MKATQRATRARRLIANTGLLPLAFTVWRTLRDWSPKLVVANARKRQELRTSIPVPPNSLIFSSTGTRDVEWFLKSGEQTAGSLCGALESIGRPIQSFNAVFELGCGCGRVLRQWSQIEGPRFHASDYNPRVVAWARENLPFISFGKNELNPPLKYGDASFDLCYAISVFTHLPEELQRPWLEEMHRVLKPGGLLLVTLSGEGDLARLNESEQKRFYEGKLVVIDPGYAGTNMCGVYHPNSYVQLNWSDLFRIRLFLPQGAKGSPNQDLYALQRLG